MAILLILSYPIYLVIVMELTKYVIKTQKHAFGVAMIITVVTFIMCIGSVIIYTCK